MAADVRTTNLEIYSAAYQLLQHHSEEASLEAARLANAMLDRGDLEGQRVWKMVLKALDELRRKEPGDGEVLH